MAPDRARSSRWLHGLARPLWAHLLSEHPGVVPGWTLGHQEWVPAPGDRRTESYAPPSRIGGRRRSHRLRHVALGEHDMASEDPSQSRPGISLSLLPARDGAAVCAEVFRLGDRGHRAGVRVRADRKSTRLNSSHPSISYAVFCLKKKKKKQT